MSRAEEKDFEDFGWLGKYLTIKEIDDVEFRKLIFASIARHDTERRFERHNTDLVYCLRASFAHKIRPQKFSEDAYSMVFHWMRGKGIEIGIVDALISLLSESKSQHGLAEGDGKGILSTPLTQNNLAQNNPSPAISQKETSIGRSRGHIDLELFGLPYEITTRLFWGSQKHPRKFPPIDKIFQKLSYLASEKKVRGRIKVYVMVPPSEMIKVESPNGLEGVTLHKKIRRSERTWELKLTKDGLKFFINTFENRDNQLSHALDTGNWRKLPKAYFPWRCKGCDICDWLENCPNEVAILWLKWRQDKKKWEIERSEIPKRSGGKAVEISSTAPPAERSSAQKPDSGSILQGVKAAEEGHNPPIGKITSITGDRPDDPPGHNPHSPPSREFPATGDRDSLIKNHIKTNSIIKNEFEENQNSPHELISEFKIPKIFVDGCGPGKDHNPRYAFLCQICGKSNVFEKMGITSNEAEYLAVEEAFQHILDEHRVPPFEPIQIISDSKLVVNQLRHKWHIKNDRLRNLAMRAWELAPATVEYVWVKRKDNLAGKLLG